MNNEPCTKYFVGKTEDGILSCGYLYYSNDSSKSYSSPGYTCLVALSGNGLLIDSKGKFHPIFDGILFQCLPGESFTIETSHSENLKVFTISIGTTSFNMLNSLNLLNINEPLFSIFLRPYLLTWFDELYNQLKIVSDSELHEVLFIANKLLISLHRENINSLSLTEAAVITGAKQMLSYRYGHILSLEEISSSFNMSYEKFRKLFKTTVGISPIQFRLQSKFQYAQRLLYEGDSIQEAAIKVGYLDPFTFSRQFKKYIGSSPNTFKKKKNSINI